MNSDVGLFFRLTAFRQGLTDLPMMSEWIDDSPDAPTILVVDWRNHFGTCCEGPFERRIRIFNGHDHPHRTTTQRLWTEVQVLWRFVGDPEFGVPHGQPSDHFSGLGFDTKRLAGPERRLLELDRFLPVSNRQHGSYRGLLIAHRKCSLSRGSIR